MRDFLHVILLMAQSQMTYARPDPRETLTLASAALEQGLRTYAGLEDAIETCRTAIDFLPDPAPARLMLARLLAAAGHAQDAVAAYRHVVACDPASARGWTGLAQSLLAVGDDGQALDAADAAIRFDPRSADAWHVRGQVLLQLMRPQSAFEAFGKGAALAPKEARMHLGLGDAAAELDRDPDALAHYAHAVAIDPGSKWAQAHLGAMHCRCGDLQAAERHCLAALALDPTLAGPHRNLAGVYAERGDPARSRHHLDQAFSGRNVIVDQGPAGAPRVLVLTAAGSGNTPFKYLLPRGRFTRIDWFIEFADPDQAARLPAHDVVFNLVGDPDYGGRTQTATAAFQADCDRPVLNPPLRIAPTRRDRLPDLLGGIDGAFTPPTVRIPPPGPDLDLPAWLGDQGLDGPVLIRPIGSHGGAGLSLAGTPEALLTLGLRREAYATAFVDFRTPVDGLYRKYRVIFIDRTPLPYHLAIKNDWLVHYVTAEMAGDGQRQAEELRFLSDPVMALGAAAWRALEAIGRRLDLDFAGIDFSLLPDGRILVFEANAAMLVHPEPDGPFAYKNPYVERITTAFHALIERRIASPS
jgi:tetratricopeptide (TPR) repeat protein